MALDPKDLVDPFKKLRKSVAKLKGQPTPKEVHDIRTRTRRMDSTLHALPQVCRRNERRLLKHTAKVRRRAGKVRDMDVLNGYARKLDVKDEQDCITELIEHLGAERYKQADKLVRVVKQKRAQMRPRLKKTIRKLRRAFNPPSNGQAAALAREAATDVLRLSTELREPARLNKNNLHPYRLKVKELRYLLQNARSEPDKQLIDALGEVKDAIGEWHDREELIAIAKKVLDKNHPGCKLVREMRTISERKFEQALSLTQHLRRQYFPPRRVAGKSSSKHLPQPILVATESVAA